MIESFKNPINNIINPEISEDEFMSEKSIRPASIKEFIGRTKSDTKLLKPIINKLKNKKNKLKFWDPTKNRETYYKTKKYMNMEKDNLEYIEDLRYTINKNEFNRLNKEFREIRKGINTKNNKVPKSISNINRGSFIKIGYSSSNNERQKINGKAPFNIYLNNGCLEYKQQNNKDDPTKTQVSSKVSNPS